MITFLKVFGFGFALLAAGLILTSGDSIRRFAMALSNIFKEPRRELMESGAGTLALVPFLLLDWWASATLTRLCGPSGPPFLFYFIIVVPIVGVIAAGAAWFFLLFLPHALGEVLCDWFEDKGLHLRPRQRAGRKCLPGTRIDCQSCKGVGTLSDIGGFLRTCHVCNGRGSMYKDGGYKDVKEAWHVEKDCAV